MGRLEGTPDTAAQASSADPRARARALVPLIRECADEADRERRLPTRVARAMAAAGLYKVAAPRSIGGGECDPRTQIETIEIVSAADGAAGWNLMIGIENMGFLGAALPLEVARKLYADEGLIVSGALNPLGRATPVPGGYRVTGQWPFASGCHNAGWFWGQCMVTTDGGELAKSEGGGAILREALIPSSEFEILDTWHVSGLRGSGSHDVVARDVFVPEERVTAVLERGMRLRETGTLYRYPPFNRLAYNKIGVATGIAQAALAHFEALAAERQPRGSRKLLREKVSVHLLYAEAVASLRGGARLRARVRRGGVAGGRRGEGSQRRAAHARAPGLLARLPGGGPHRRAAVLGGGDRGQLHPLSARSLPPRRSGRPPAHHGLAPVEGDRRACPAGPAR